MTTNVDFFVVFLTLGIAMVLYIIANFINLINTIED